MSLPTFVIIGERRCGSTFLYNCMRSHPEVYLYPEPDLDYFIAEELFERKWIEAKESELCWEENHSPHHYAAMFQEPEGVAAIGHKGADLLFWRPAHARVARFLPDAKFVITLREPVGRAWSHYWNMAA